jgi:hypothetical protein
VSHICPGPACTVHVADHMLMCRPHWYQVPRMLRSAVWAAWDGGYGAGSDEHMEAMRAAIESLKARQA